MKTKNNKPQPTSQPAQPASQPTQPAPAAPNVETCKIKGINTVTDVFSELNELREFGFTLASLPFLCYQFTPAEKAAKLAELRANYPKYIEMLISKYLKSKKAVNLP